MNMFHVPAKRGSCQTGSAGWPGSALRNRVVTCHPRVDVSVCQPASSGECMPVAYGGVKGLLSPLSLYDVHCLGRVLARACHAHWGLQAGFWVANGCRMLPRAC